MVTPDMSMPSITDGSKNIFRLLMGSIKNETYSIGGDQYHQIAGNTIAKVPTQKLGNVMKAMDKLLPA